MFELQRGDRRALAVVPDQPGEGGDRPGVRHARGEGGEHGAGVERLGLDPDHPPLIGGRKAISSPSASGGVAADRARR